MTDYLDWVEIFAGREMSEWIENNDEAQWYKMSPGFYWLRPDLYAWWKLRYR